MGKAQVKTPSLMGRLKGFGLKEPWQVGLLMPEGWDDLRMVVTDFRNLREGDRVCIRGVMKNRPYVNLQGTPRMHGKISDNNGIEVGFTEFGDTRELQERLAGRAMDMALYGEVRSFKGNLELAKFELVEPAWLGRVRPRYKGMPRVMKPESVRAKVLELLPSHYMALCDWLWMELCANNASHGELAAQVLGAESGDREAISKRLAGCIRALHLPRSPDEAAKAKACITRLAAMGVYRKSLKNRPISLAARWRSPADIDQVMKDSGMTLSPDQVKAVREIALDMAGERPMRRILVGDVGSGKTLVYGCALCACVRGFGRVAVLMPSKNLARQVWNDLIGWWPELELQGRLVLGEGDKKSQLGSERLVVGTTAILHKQAGIFDLCIVDEQQKYSREQREALVKSASHSLEASATCIPRSTALVKYGVVQMSRLEKLHVEKEIVTKLWPESERRGLFAGVQETLREGGKVLVIYPVRAAKAAKGDVAGLPSAEEGFERWTQAFPGQVRLAHADMEDAENDSAITDVKSGRASILISTLLVEVGMTIPKLKRIVIVHPERFGLTTLHQLRGRVAREGGKGWCDLYMPKPIAAASMERCRQMEVLKDGFSIAEADLKLRGFGDLGSNSDAQSGADETFLFGEGLSVEDLDEVIRLIQKKEKKG